MEGLVVSLIVLFSVCVGWCFCRIFDEEVDKKAQEKVLSENIDSELIEYIIEELKDD